MSGAWDIDQDLILVLKQVCLGEAFPPTCVSAIVLSIMPSGWTWGVWKTTFQYIHFRCTWHTYMVKEKYIYVNTSIQVIVFVQLGQLLLLMSTTFSTTSWTNNYFLTFALTCDVLAFNSAFPCCSQVHSNSVDWPEWQIHTTWLTTLQKDVWNQQDLLWPARLFKDKAQ